MTHKSLRIAGRVAMHRGRGLDPRFVGFFDCFNRRLFYEAHEVLEDLWLLDRKGADGGFYKGLIQLAGAFVHLEKNRVQPCLALLRLARGNLSRYPAVHHGLDVAAVRVLIEQWEGRVEDVQAGRAPLRAWEYPTLEPMCP